MLGFCLQQNSRMAMIFFVTTLLLVVVFQANINITTATVLRKTPPTAADSQQQLNKSFLVLQQEFQQLLQITKDLQSGYKTLKQDVRGLKRFHKCEPCKASTKVEKICDCTDIEPKKDCLDFYQHGYKVNGVYRLLNGPGFHTQILTDAYCDQTTQGGGWTVFQRRQDGSVDFNRNWNDYKNGFGDIDGEFWFGNENIYDLTKPSFAPKKSQLLINMLKKGRNKMEYVKYNTFEITDAKSQFTLKIKGLSGNETNWKEAMDYNNGQKFSTFDQDNDDANWNCAARGGAWWYAACSNVHLNIPSIKSLSWEDWDPTDVVFVEMKTRRNL